MCICIHIHIYQHSFSFFMWGLCTLYIHIIYVIYMLHEHRYFIHIPVFAAGLSTLFITLSFFLSATQIGPRFLIEGMSNTRLCWAELGWTWAQNKWELDLGISDAGQLPSKAPPLSWPSINMRFRVLAGYMSECEIVNLGMVVVVGRTV